MAVSWPTISDLEEQMSVASGSLSGNSAATRALSAATTLVAERCELSPSQGDGIPEPVAQAILLYAAKFYRRRQTPDGVAGSADGVGVVRTGRYDADAEAMLAPYLVIGMA